ncbi:MAG: glycosyltransferase family 4 protein [Gammaproteobacteria bacterium]|nr:glycosyltransferase family 4 protein [Gammaproteobacteria bacterium]
MNNSTSSNLLICHVNLAKGFRGGERQTQLLIQALADTGVPQILIARSDSPLHSKLAGTAGLSHVAVSKPYFTAVVKVAKLKPSILHAHDAKAAQWAFLYSLIYKTRYLITRRVPNPLGRNFVTRAVYRNAAAVVALSNAIKCCVNTLLAGIEVRIIPSMYASFPVDKEEVARLQKRYTGKFVIGHIGALVNRHKGQAVAIEAARLVAEKYPDIHFVFLGAGEDEQWLRKLADGLSNVEFVGFVADVGNWIAAFDLFVFPSYQEGLGSTLLDVMQGGCPIIASATDGILDVIEHEVNGLLVPAGNPEKLTAAIEQLYADPGMCRQLTGAGLQRLGLYSPQQIASRYHNLYLSLCNDKRR